MILGRRSIGGRGSHGDGGDGGGTKNMGSQWYALGE